MLVMMTFSSRLDRRGYTRAKPIARIEIGMAASITCPTFKPEYAEATLNMMHSSTPQPTERQVSSGTVAPAGTIGLYTAPGASGVYASSGSDFVSDMCLLPAGSSSHHNPNQWGSGGAPPQAL